MWASSPTKCLPIGFRRAACPHAAVMVRWLSGGGLRAARPTGGLQEVRWGGDTRACHPTRTFVGQGPCALPWVREGNPPVSALPCQPPLGKGAVGTGDADCHSQFANWPRNDMVFARSRCKAGGRTGSFAPTGSFWLYLHRKIYISKAKEEDS